MALDIELFKISKVLLLYGGILTQEMHNWSKLSQKLYKAFSLSSQVIYASCLPLFSVEICREFRADIEAALAAMKGFTFVGVVIAKMFIVQSTKIRKLLELASEEELRINLLTDPESKRIHRTHATFCHIVASAIAFSSFVTGTTYVADGLYRSNHFFNTEFNITSATPKPHPVQLWFPFDKNKYYKIAMAYEISHIIQTLIYNGVTQALVSSVLIFLRSELKMLQHNLRNIKPCRTNTNSNMNVNAQNTLRYYAKQHQYLVRWIDKFNASFQYIILLEYCVTSLTLATILFEVIEGHKIAFNAVFFSLTTLQLFTLSWNANEILLETSSGLSDALYECNWYDLDKTSKTFIQIMIMRCRKPQTISIGPFGFMTLDAAASRMKLTYSVVSVLST